MGEVKISVIVPVYKTEDYLRKCVDSVLSQAYDNFEVLLINDGSPDGCGEICEEYAAKDSRVVYIRKENGGLSNVRNVGLRNAAGEYVYFLDSDDWMCENVLPRVVEIIAATGRKDVYFGSYFWCYPDNNTTWLNEFALDKKVLERANPYQVLLHLQKKSYTLGVHRLFFRREIIIRTGHFFREDLTHNEDTEYLFTHIPKCASFGHLNFPVMYYLRDRPGSLTTVKSRADERMNMTLSVWKELQEFFYEEYKRTGNRTALKVMRFCANYFLYVVRGSKIYSGDKEGQQRFWRENRELAKNMRGVKYTPMYLLYRYAGFDTADRIVERLKKVRAVFRCL